MNALNMKSYAKVNLLLKIGKKLSSGYHKIESIMQQIQLWDNMRFEKLPGEEISISSNNPSLESEENLSYKVAEFLKNKYKAKGGISIAIEKNIPLASGLGGGSSNAATAILALNRLWRLRLKEKELINAASKIGSDVPFFIVGGTALVTGIGESVKRIDKYPKINYVLINPGYRISSENAYGYYDKLKAKEKAHKAKENAPNPASMAKSLLKGDIEGTAQCAYNSLEKAIFNKHKDLADIKALLHRNGALNTVMSGSGPTIVGIFNSIYEARETFFKLKDSYPFVFLTKSV